MNKLDTTDKTCVASLKLLGDYWTLRIIDALSIGEQRYCDLQRGVDGLNPATFTARLKKLEEAKLVGRKEESETCVTYFLTSLGKEALPVLKAVDKFSARAKILN